MKRQNRRIILIVLLALIVLSGISIVVIRYANKNKAGDDVVELIEKQLDEVNKFCSVETRPEEDNSRTAFALEMFKKVCAASDSNVCFSPLAAEYGLMMIANAADGQTLGEIMTTMKRKPELLEQMNKEAKNYMSFINEEHLDSVSMYNMMWLNNLKEPSYTSKCKRYFDAEISTLDFNSNDAKKTMEASVRKKTKGLLKPEIGDISDAKIILMNLLSFKGKWKFPFYEEFTEKSTFHNADGTEAKVYMMHGIYEDGECSYQHTNKGYSVVSLRFSDRHYEMELYLPDEGKSVDGCIAKFDNAPIVRDENIKVKLYLPRFDVSASADLVSIFRTMGITSAFNEMANFSKLSTPDQYVRKILHSARVSIDESGCMAAACNTTVLLSKLCEMNEVKLRFDRPFFYIIRETDSRTALFMGRVNKL